MESLSKALYTVVSNSVDEFAQILSTKYEMPKEEIIELWNEKVSSELKVTPKVTKKATATRTRSKPVTNDNSESTANCTYVFKKGQHNGNQCTAKVCSESTSFCRKHKDQEGKSSEKPVSTNTKKSTGSTKVKATEQKERETPAVKKLGEASSKGMTLRKNKFDNYEHSETKFIFDKTTKEVIGRQLDDGTVAELTVEDIEACKKHSFKYRMPATLTGEIDDDEVEELEESEEEEDEEEDEEEEEDE